MVWHTSFAASNLQIPPRTHASVAECLQAISNTMTEQYQRAEAAGHTPSENWLLPSRDFN